MKLNLSPPSSSHSVKAILVKSLLYLVETTSQSTLGGLIKKRMPTIFAVIKKMQYINTVEQAIRQRIIAKGLQKFPEQNLQQKLFSVVQLMYSGSKGSLNQRLNCASFMSKFKLLYFFSSFYLFCYELKVMYAFLGCINSSSFAFFPLIY